MMKNYMINEFVIDADKINKDPKFGKDYHDELL